MWQRGGRIVRRVVAVAFLVTIIVFSSTALANQDLMEELPESHDTVIAVDFDELRGSPLYEQVFEILANHESAGYMVGRLRDDFSIDIKTDLDALVITSDSPPLSKSMLDQPGGAIEDAATRDSEGALVIIRGDIDPDALFAEAAESSDEELDPEAKQIRLDGLELARLSDRTMAIAVGTEDYLDETRQLIESDRSGPGAVYDRAVDQLGASQGLYMMIEPSIANPDQMREEMGALATFAALTVDLKQQVQLASLVSLEDSDAAAQMVEEVDGMRQEAGNNPMMSIFGLAPLLENMSVQQDSADIYIRTSMSNDEAGLLVRQIGGIMSSRQDLQKPLEGRGMESDDSGDDESQPSDTESDDDGVDAPFN